MSLKSELNKKWENYVNSYLFANFKNLEYWVAKREAVENNIVFNYIRFPKPENGKLLSIEFIKLIVQSIEANIDECSKIFGPKYKIGTAEIQNDDNDISIIWNKMTVDELLELDLDENSSDKQYLEDQYMWDIDKNNKIGSLIKLTPEESKRREKIDRILRLMAIELNDPKMAPENRDMENLEQTYNKYDWENSKYWKEVDDPKKQIIKWEYNSKMGRFTYHNLLTLRWFDHKTGSWVK